VRLQRKNLVTSSGVGEVLREKETSEPDLEG
jgi:hypothetical protein